ncbi:MTHFR-domain-containing protein [Tilletiaria anomala UBC 951]|uniref:MTHFR-domain-containing protein n=1 Tax=Tilletiaria anomala (strain ATCC 24038 / CBS 436.72 / UBC 951) TaxID=1037660 RepID=A0A066VBR4_TILAU|nr:MTHFR-domain-containing protein [Tilletiaria anomala UBC 951]KDN38871.1 MTHFR-domain-containing protein [Tilletiaria anomala UBC 951]
MSDHDISAAHQPSPASSLSLAHPSHLTTKLAKERPLYSLEFFPPKTTQGLENLYARIARMARPAWVNVTWGAGGSTDRWSVEMATRIQKGQLPYSGSGSLSLESKLKAHQLNQGPDSPGSPSSAEGDTTSPSSGIDALLHLTCTNVTVESLRTSLAQARNSGVRNILALRGDPPRGHEYWVAADDRFQHAVDLVRFIRQEHGDFFCIGVAGYPEGHPDDALLANHTVGDGEHGIDLVERDIQNLLAKQAAGAQFVITQLFYDVDAFLAWERRAHAAGVHIPIVPGMMPIVNFQSFRRMTMLCKVGVPPRVLSALEQIKADDAQVRTYGIELCANMIARIWTEPHSRVKAFHLCTLNLEKSVSRVLAQCSWWNHSTAAAAARQGEECDINSTNGISIGRNRKIQTDTIIRNDTWDEFPNGRFGDIRSPAYGEMDGYGASLKVPPAEALRAWGHPTSIGDISDLFIKYLEGKLEVIPWCDGPLMQETESIREALLRLNASPTTRNAAGESGKAWWTVGSQPSVDGIDSSDPAFGFGPRGGYVYQKAFVEFFITEQEKEALKEQIAEHGSSVVSFFAGNRHGAFETNMEAGKSNAVTWAVFPGREIVQPTIIEEDSFKAWCQEAFAIWAEWELLFPPQSATKQLLHEIGEQRWLITVVHHEYRDPDALWRFLTTRNSNSTCTTNNK